LGSLHYERAEKFREELAERKREVITLNRLLQDAKEKADERISAVERDCTKRIDSLVEDLEYYEQACDVYAKAFKLLPPDVADTFKLPPHPFGHMPP
jgi:hypothetical protein